MPIIRILRDSMRTLTGLSGEYVTFDQNVQNAISAEFEFLAASLPDGWLLEVKSVIGTIGQTVRVKIFWYFKISKYSIPHRLANRSNNTLNFQ